MAKKYKDVAVDIETLGLLHERPLPPITCVCMYDGAREWSVRTWRLPEAELAVNRQIVIDVLDNAERIVGYNSVLFDIEFMRRSWGLDDARTLAWQRKCVDPYQTMRLLYGGGGKLQTMLTLNDLGSKTGTGGDAITLARTDQWDELLAYCLMDARLTYDLVCTREWVRVTPGLECSFTSVPRFRFFVDDDAEEAPTPTKLRRLLPPPCLVYAET